MDGVVEAEEAFNCALAVKNPSDSPNFDESSEIGGDIALAQRYTWWWWCILILPVLEKYYLGPHPDPEFYAKVQSITPDLEKLLRPALDAAGSQVPKKLTPEIQSVVEKVFTTK